MFHLLCALPIVVTPVLQKAEELMNRREWIVLTIVIRSVLVAAFTLIAVFLPYFLQLMAFVTDISVTISCYMLPPIFYWAMFRTRNPIMVLALLLTLVFGVVGSGVGCYTAMKDLINAVKDNPNPFKGIFDFDT